MQLDKTRIAIRERSLLELLDLALHVVVEYRWPWLVTSLIFAMPLALINDILIRGMGEFAYQQDNVWAMLTFIYPMSLLVFLEAPLAAVLTTLYLGRAMFLDTPRFRDIVRQAFMLAPCWISCQAILRGTIPALLLILILSPRDAASSGLVHLFLTPIAMYAMLCRALRPFLNEVILLERTPIRRETQSTITLWQRLSVIHRARPGDMVMQWFVSALAAVIITLSFVEFFWLVSWIAQDNLHWGPMMVRVGVPASMWIVASFFAVVRFLDYLDCRIRDEGWEVELQMRAEANRLPKLPA